jgi:hypothetical protein
MIVDQCISITELKRSASSLIKSLKKDGRKIVFVNNKPVAVLADIDNFDLSIEEPFDFDFGPEGVSPKLILDKLNPQ